MGMSFLINVKRMFQRRKYERVQLIGPQDGHGLDLVAASHHDQSRISPPPAATAHKRRNRSRAHQPSINNNIAATHHDVQDHQSRGGADCDHASVSVSAAGGGGGGHAADHEIWRSLRMNQAERRPRLILVKGILVRKQMKSQKRSSIISTTPAAPGAGAPANKLVALHNFLEGPSQHVGDDDVYQQQCRDLLRKLSARGNRVPGFV